MRETIGVFFMRKTKNKNEADPIPPNSEQLYAIKKID
jgi:hypothetical protein